VSPGTILTVSGTITAPDTAPEVATDERVEQLGFVVQAAYDQILPG
jgi:hypothetical protein